MKLKGIDGGPHKRWSMWFNSKQRAEPYQGLTWERRGERSPFCSNATFRTGAAWLSSARVVRCWVKSRNERNPRFQLPPARGPSGETAGDNPEEGVDDVKSSWPLHPGLHTCYNGHGEYVPGPCTHRPSSHGRRECSKSCKRLKQDL